MHGCKKQVGCKRDDKVAIVIRVYRHMMWIFLLLLTRCAIPQGDFAVVSDSTQQNNFSQEGQIINANQSYFRFEGFKPGGTHGGEFTNFTGTLTGQDYITGAQGIIYANSVRTDSNRFTDHLISNDFLKAQQYPIIEFVSTQDIHNNTMVGQLTFLGVTKEISFPVNITNNTVSADFLLDTSPFGMEYPLVDSRVRLQFLMTRE